MSFTPVPPERLRSSLPAVDIDGFFRAVDQALQVHLKSQKWPAGTQPTFIHDFPKERLANPNDPFDLVTFHVAGAEMAPSSNDGSRVPRAPQLRESVPDPGKLGYNTSVLAWKELVTVVFSIWSRSNKRADDITNWFHSFMMAYGHHHKFFMARGVDLFRFVERKEDDAVKIADGQEAYRRRLCYQIRIEYLQPVLDKQLEYVTINVTDGNTGETDSIERPNP